MTPSKAASHRKSGGHVGQRANKKHKRDDWLLAKPNTKKGLTDRQWAKWEKVGLEPDFDLDRIVLNWIDARVTDLDVTGAVTGLKLNMSIEEAPTVEMRLLDPDGKLFSTMKGRWWEDDLTPAERRRKVVPVDQGWAPIKAPSLKGRVLDCTLNGVTFRLVKVNWQHSTSEWTLTFEHRLVYWLRRITGARRGSRDAMTRAQFILSQMRECDLAKGRYRFVCPELRKVQPIDAGAGADAGTSGLIELSTSKGPILWVGDSLAVGTIPPARSQLKGRAIQGDGVVGRSSTDSATKLVQLLKPSHKVIVFDAGTNDGGPSVLEDSLQKVRKAIGSRPLFIATVNRTSAQSGAEGMNAVVRAFGAKPGVTVIDWRNDGKKYVPAGEVHPTTRGYDYRARLFATALGKGGGNRQAVSSSNADTEGGNGGYSSSKHLTVNGKGATADQLRVGRVVLSTAFGITDERKALNALMAACIVESGIQNLTYGDSTSRGVLQLLSTTASGLGVSANDVAGCVKLFLTRGFWGKGGAISLAKKNPSMSPGHVAQNTQGSAFPDRYDQVMDEAVEWVNAWDGGSLNATLGPGQTENMTYRKQYQFARNADEGAWESMGRLAEEVNWRRFVVGNSLYYMSEPALYKRRVRYLVDRDDPAVLDLAFDVDWGKPISEASLSVVLDRWGAPPGSVIELEDFGPADGRWLVTGVARDWFSPVAEVSLKTPTKAKAEPAAETVTKSRTGAAAADGAGVAGDLPAAAAKFLARAIQISERNLPYAWGGGHNSSGSASPGQRGEGVGYDCSGYIGACLIAAGVPYDGRASTTFGSLPGAEGGRGNYYTVYYNSQHVFAIFEDGMKTSWDRADTSRYGTPTTGGPHVRKGARPMTGFNACHFPVGD